MTDKSKPAAPFKDAPDATASAHRPAVHASPWRITARATRHKKGGTIIRHHYVDKAQHPLLNDPLEKKKPLVLEQTDLHIMQYTQLSLN